MTKNIIIKTISSLWLICYLTYFCIAQTDNNDENDQEENVVAQMNYCITSLTNIINDKSMATLEHETDQIINNLTMEQIKGLYDIIDFRTELLYALGKFEITEEERILTKRLQSMKRDNIKWTAISNALNPTMLLTGRSSIGPQLAFQAALTAARSAVEYKAMQGEQDIEELRAMWELRKEDLKTISNLRQQAQQIVFKLYTKYNLKENDRLTESTADAFSTYISESEAAKRCRLLEDHYDTYQKFAPYYYYLGMSYLDLGQYEQAQNSFETYLTLYNKTPILRYDEKSGCIALAQLVYEKDLNNEKKEQLINIALKNMPGNSAALLQCVMVYLYDIHDNEKAFHLLRMGIDDPKASDIDILLMAAANLMPTISKYPQLKKEIYEGFSKQTQIHLDTYLTFIVNTQSNAFDDITRTITISNYCHRKWYLFWKGKFFSNHIHITLPQHIEFDFDDMAFYIEQHESEYVIIKQLKTSFTNGINIDKINKVSCFKHNNNLKYLFMDAIIPNEVFLLKPNIDINKIKNEKWPRMSDFTLSQNDVKDIVKFCKKHISANGNVEIDCDPINSNMINIESNCEIPIMFQGKSLTYTPYHSQKQAGYYLRLVLSNGISILYKYQNGKLAPYLYTNNTKSIFANSDFKYEYEFHESTLLDENFEEVIHENIEKPSLIKRIGNFFSQLWHKLF